MAKYTQATRLMAVSTPLGDDVLLLAGFKGREGLSELFSFNLELLADRTQAVSFDDILGQGVTVRLAVPDGSQRYFHGIVRRFRRTGRDENLVRFEAEIVPTLWLWTRKVRCRIFQQKSVPDILKAVFKGLEDTRYELTGSYPQRDFVVQYRESDFAFVSRLMEEEGISYYFKHGDGKHQLIVTDAPATFAEAPWPGTVLFDAQERFDEVRIRRWEKAQEVRPGSVTLDDYTFELPAQDLRSKETIAEGVEAGSVHHSFRLANNDLEIYDYPAGFAKRFDGISAGGSPQAGDLSQVFPEGKRVAKVRMEQESVEALRIEGTSTCLTFTAGARFTLGRHDDGDGDYLLMHVEHTASIRGNFHSGDFEGLEYRNEFACVPKALPVRPAIVTPRPHILGPQTATVTGPSGQDLFVDRYGRVKLHFHWDRTGPTDGGSSCWVRVGQIWAGNRYGAFFWPRIGQEVIVAFEDGDPDQPLVVGSVYNAAQMPPFELPANELVTGIKSCSAEGGDPLKNFNGLLFYDKPGEEHVQIHSERHETFNTESSKWMHVGQSHTRVVGGLSPPGSGGGGGSGEGDSGPAKLYGDADSLGSWAKDLDFVAGVNIENVLGITGDYIVGSYNELIINPFGFLAQFGGAGIAATMARGVGAVAGALTFVVGADSTLVYGPEVNIHRGAKYEYSDHSVDLWYVAGATLIGSMAMAVSVASGLAPGSVDQYLVGFGGVAIYELALGLWVGLETLNAKAQAAEKEAFTAENLAAAIVGVQTLATGMANAAARRASQAAAAAASAASAAAAASASAASHNKTYTNNYSLHAYDITLRSAAPAMLGPAGAQAPGASIILDAQGSSAAAENGLVAIMASGGACMVAGPGGLAMKREAEVAQVILTGGPAGTVVVQQGLPDVGANMMVTPEGVKIGIGAPGEGAFLLLTPMGAKLQFAEWFIAITEAGITFSVGENEFTMTPGGFAASGLSFEVEADSNISLNAPMIEQDADGEGGQNAGMLMLE